MKKWKWVKWLVGVAFVLSLFPALKDSDHFLPFVLIWSILGFTYLFINWIIQRMRIRKLLKQNLQAEMAMLKSQVNPHFFFNTLNNLYGLSVEKSDDAPEIILKLSDVMRYTIYEGEKDRVLLTAEIKCLEDYIELNRIRFKSLNVTFDHTQINEDLTIAPLIFMVLLENAFKHGVEKLAVDAYVKMKLVASDTHIGFSVENNFDPAVRKGEGGLGLKNLRKRLLLLYPGKHQLEIATDVSNVHKVRLDIQL